MRLVAARNSTPAIQIARLIGMQVYMQEQAEAHWHCESLWQLKPVMVADDFFVGGC